MTTDPAERLQDIDPLASATDTVTVESLSRRAQSAGGGRQVVSVGLPVQALPRLTPAVRQCLGRLPVRRQVESVAGLPLWLPRLGVTLLPHELVGGGWLCTVVGAEAARPDEPESDGVSARLPTGVFCVDDLEVVTAIAVCGGMSVQANLSADEFADAWAVRLAAVDPRYHVGTALLAGADRNRLTVVADGAARRLSGYRTVSAFRNACARLCAMGFLIALDDHGSPASATPTHADGPGVFPVVGAGEGVRYRLRLPRPGWPR